MNDRENPDKGEVVEVDDRFGFRFIEYVFDHDFTLGPGASRFSNLIFLVTGFVVLGVFVFGLITKVSVKAPVSGTMEPERVHKIYPLITGRVTDLRLKRGALVSAGDTLAMLSAEDYEQTLADLNFQSAQQESTLTRLQRDYDGQLALYASRIRTQELAIQETGTRGGTEQTQAEQSLAQAEGELAKAEVTLDAAKQKVRDNEVLVERGVVARKQLDDAKREETIAQADYNVRRQAVRTARAQVDASQRSGRLGGAKGEEELVRLRSEQASLEAKRGSEIGAAEDKLRDIRRRVERGETNIGRQAVLCEANGVLLEIKVSAGETVASQTLIAEVADLDQLVFKATVPEVHRKRLATGQTAVLKFPSYPDYEFRGSVREISPRPQFIQNQSLYEVKLDIQPPEKLPMLRSGEDVTLLPGLTASGNVFVDRMMALKYVVVVKMLKRG